MSYTTTLRWVYTGGEKLHLQEERTVGTLCGLWPGKCVEDRRGYIHTHLQCKVCARVFNKRVIGGTYENGEG
jgi:hypothetical protein